MNHLEGIDDVVSAASSSVPTPADIDSTWVLVTSFSALLAILGFAFIGSGAVRYKSVQSAVITVFLGSVVALVFFWLLGYGFAFGDDSGNQFIGFSRFAAAGYTVDDSRDDYTNLIFQSIGAIVVACLFGFGTLERSRFFSVSLCLMFISGFLYPTALHWVQPTGWLKKFGFVDFAGASYIHVFGGVTALVVSFFLKERRDQAGNVHPGIFPHHSPINIGYGSVLLTITLIVYLSGANQEGKNSAYLQGLIACNALVAATFGALASFLLQYLRTHKTSLIALSRGSVAGVVAVSAVVNHLRIWEAALIGIFAGIIYISLTLAIHRSHVDDPAYTIATHFGPGLLGTLLVGVFSLDTGLLTGHGAKQLGIQIVGLLALSGWALLVALFIVPLKGSGVFKINPFQESQGIDLSYADGEAYTFLDQQPEPALLSGSPRKGIFQ